MDHASGVVYLVGAGPGDPELLTVKAVRLLEQADAIVYDRLVSDEVIDLARPGAMRISVGKQPNHHPVPQSEINEILRRLAESGRNVVRLKGGDPFIFGRGSEEVLHLSRHGIRVEVVPGVTAAQGCAAALRVPLTHRGLATGLRYVTGHCRAGLGLDLEWESLADPDTTLVIYMGHANIAEIAMRLTTHGLSPDTPVLAVARGTTPRQREFLTSLDALEADVARAEMDGPVLFIIGKVAALANEVGALTGAEGTPRHASAG